MPQQLTFAQAEYAAKKKVTRREQFLKDMEQVLPRSALHAAIAPHYYRETDRGPGHPPIGLDRMLRMYLLQQWYSLADEALEDAIYDSSAFRHFLGIDLGRDSVPDATTLLGFPHLLEAKGLQAQLLETINALLRERGLLMNQGTLVDASIIDAPSSTKNKDKRRDPEMHQTRKGNQWYFGMKAHIGVDLHSGLALGAGAQPHRDGSQRGRRQPDRQSAARRGEAGLRRRRLHRGGQTRGTPRLGRDLAHCDEAVASSKPWTRDR